MTEDQVGEAAGVIWQTLNNGSEMSMTQLKEATESSKLNKDILCAGIGWLMREGKIVVSGKKFMLKR
jgi:hypothetical protein